MVDHLIIPDGHAHPDYNNSRFDLVGKYIADTLPHVVVDMGDTADMPSLCNYDKGKKGFERNSYRADIDVARDASARIKHYIRSRKRKQPAWFRHKGNHEVRIDRAISLDHVLLEGVIGYHDFQFEEDGWTIIDYNGSTPGVNTIDGIAYAHYFTSGIMGRPISGVHPAYQLLHKQYQSCVQGHTHTMDMCMRTKADGTNILGIVSGVFIDYHMEYAGEANNLWWKGLVHIKNIENGFGDPEFISIEQLKKVYGS